MTSARRSVLFSCSALAALVAACGGAAPEPMSPKSMVAEPSTIEEAQAQIANARAELGVDATTGTTADAAPAAPPPPPPSPAPTASSKSEDLKKTIEGAPSQCASPCRALASMRRAVTALCRMTGDEDARCLDARRTLQSSELRVTPCSC